MSKQSKNPLPSQVPRCEQHAIESLQPGSPPHALAKATVHGVTCGAQRSGGGGLCRFLFLRPFFSAITCLASVAKGLARAATTPAAPRVKNERRRETPAVASRMTVS